MTKYFLFFLLFTPMFFHACQSNETEQLHSEIMAIHDEVMPKTGELSYLSIAFNKKLETDSSISLTIKNELIRQVNDLEAAEEEMMVWMNQYTPPASNKSTKSKEEWMTYLKEQKVIIGNVKVHTMESLKKARELKKELSINE
jgi:hypothetical protein